MKKWIEIPGLETWVEAEYIQGKLWAHFGGKTFCIDEQKPKSSYGKKSDIGGSLDLTAPMPGKITKILVKLHQVVKKGDALIVMEAMKMEYTLKAGTEGIVDQIRSKPGDQVAMGALLIELVAPVSGSSK